LSNKFSFSFKSYAKRETSWCKTIFDSSTIMRLASTLLICFFREWIKLKNDQFDFLLLISLMKAWNQYLIWSRALMWRIRNTLFSINLLKCVVWFSIDTNNMILKKRNKEPLLRNLSKYLISLADQHTEFSLSSFVYLRPKKSKIKSTFILDIFWILRSLKTQWKEKSNYE